MAMKRPGESFSEIVRRLARRGSLTELAGVMNRKAADAVADAIDANRDARILHRRRELGLP